MDNQEEMYFVDNDGEIVCYYDVENMIDFIVGLGYDLVTAKEHHQIIKDIKSGTES